MSRETRIGLILAVVLLLVVGGVLGYKFYFADRLTEMVDEDGVDEVQTAEQARESVGSAPAKPSKPGKASPTETGPELAPPPKTNGPELSAPPSTASGTSSRPEPSGLSRPDAGGVRSVSHAEAGLEEPPPPTPPESELARVTMPPAAEAGGRPEPTPAAPVEPPSPEPPTESATPAVDRPVVPNRPTPTPIKVEDPPPLPPPASVEPVVIPPSPPAPAGRAELTKERGPEPISVSPTLVRAPEPPVAPVPPPSTFDRKYDPPAANLSKPVFDSAPPPAPSAPSSSGIPVTIRPQPDLPPAPASSSGAGGVPVVISRPRGTGTPAAVSTPQVESFDVETYVAKQGDTYASISQAKYKSDKYEQALALFNRDRNPQMTTPQPGKQVYLPPADYLERRYGLGVTAPPAPTTSPSSGGTSGVLGSPVSRYSAVAPPPTTTKDAAKADWALPSGAKQYRVRPNDTIWSIAKQTLGSGDRWPDIARLNKDRLRDPNQLQPGMILLLPADANVGEAPQ